MNNKWRSSFEVFSPLGSSSSPSTPSQQYTDHGARGLNLPDGVQCVNARGVRDRGRGGRRGGREREGYQGSF